MYNLGICKKKNEVELIIEKKKNCVFHFLKLIVRQKLFALQIIIQNAMWV